MSSNTTEEDVESLLRRLIDNDGSSFEIGTLTSSVYDTAWVALVAKTSGGIKQWLFPSSFIYVLQTQSMSGAWPAHAGEDCVDDYNAILSTLAALYCLMQHQKMPLQLEHLHCSNLKEKIEKGKRSLKDMLKQWDVQNCPAVGFEVLVPNLLSLLEKEDIQFTFPHRAELFETRRQKLAKIPPNALYERAPSALLHSLEAFHSQKDFSVDRMAHQKVNWSIMASPSATASYLVRCKI